MSGDAQGDLFGDEEAAPADRPVRPDPGAVRVRLERLLARLRAADRMPLSEHELRAWRIVVPNMAGWLPAEEAAAIRAAFAREMARLGASPDPGCRGEPELRGGEPDGARVVASDLGGTGGAEGSRTPDL